MQLPLSKEEQVKIAKDYYKDLITQAQPHAFTLNISLASNPFLKDQGEFKFLNSKLKDYNNRISKGAIKDPYEMLSYQKMHSMLSDLAQVETRQDQITALGQIFKWFKEQLRLIQQRFDQGYVRYEMTKQYRDALKQTPQKVEEVIEQELDIPFYIIERIIEPYRMNWRSLHKDFQNPDKRLKEYKVKTLNILNLGGDGSKEEGKKSRVLYPMPPKWVEPKQEQHEVKEGQTEGQPPAENTEQPPVVDGQKVDGLPAQEAPEQPGMDIGIGEQPEEPQDEQPQQVPDKLKPKNPIYVDAVSSENVKKYKEGYMFYQGDDRKEERNMDLRYLKFYHDKIRKQREDTNQIQIAHDWAKRKARIAKDMQKKLQQMKFKPQYSFSNEPALAQERLSAQDQLKFGFTTNVRAKPRSNEVDLTLPELYSTTKFGLEEKTIRRDRISSLRNKFAKVLNLVDRQQRQSAPSLCQYTSRRRGLSEIIRNHSHSRERLVQLEEVGKIKERLTKVKVNVNIRALSQGLCLPESEDYFSQTAREFPTKQLPSNPDMIDKKKKKKKKK